MARTLAKPPSSVDIGLVLGIAILHTAGADTLLSVNLLDVGVEGTGYPYKAFEDHLQ